MFVSVVCVCRRTLIIRQWRLCPPADSDHKAMTFVSAGGLWSQGNHVCVRRRTLIISQWRLCPPADIDYKERCLYVHGQSYLLSLVDAPKWSLFRCLEKCAAVLNDPSHKVQVWRNSLGLWTIETWRSNPSLNEKTASHFLYLKSNFSGALVSSTSS